MKNLKSILVILAAILAVTLSVSSCNKKDNNNQTTLTAEDLQATVSMDEALSMMHHAQDSLVATPHHTNQLHWDSVYHHHDSTFWNHHNNYHHETYTHDDHSHTWVPYDTTVNHTSHLHHSYPNHPHDSLVTHPNAHLHDNTNNHHPGHDINHHHNLDSLHHQHILHHP